ncbi:hypothetical protein RHSP_82740 [Rhizobium freirei PRF 81]|uniref:Lipoprotein n=2 Tax=Rhizobium freirei TaxID=1353277 RepID=N6V340_9HYPH|nr:hypothetical protein RHSP_82740 [Rhizobium freirei PRF 81]
MAFAGIFPAIAIGNLLFGFLKMKPSIVVVGLPLFVGGCASSFPPDVVPSSDVAQARSVAPFQYNSPVSGYIPRKPVDPKPWRQQNDQQSPAKGDAS